MPLKVYTDTESIYLMFHITTGIYVNILMERRMNARDNSLNINVIPIR